MKHHYMNYYALLLGLLLALIQPVCQAKHHAAKTDQTQATSSSKSENEMADKPPKNCIRRPKPKEDTWMRKTGKWIESQFAGSSRQEDKPAKSKELAK